MLFLKSVALNPPALLKTVHYRNGMRKFPTIHGAYPLPSFCPYKGLMDPPSFLPSCNNYTNNYR